MPAIAAHYQFGQLVLEQGSRNLRGLTQEHLPMFHLGAQGPDLLFYHRPYQANPVAELGSAMHRDSGGQFFKGIWDDRGQWRDEGWAYLLGLCCHYALDRACHPYVDSHAPNGIAHQVLESELDWLVIQAYGLEARREKMVAAKGISVAALAQIYPQVKPGALRRSVKTIEQANRLLNRRGLVTWIEGVLGKQGKFSSLCLPDEVPSTSPAHGLMPLLEGAVSDGVALTNLVLEVGTTAEALQMAMRENFGGVLCESRPEAGKGP